MTQLQFTYRIRFDFPRQPESPAAVAEKFLKTLDSLSRTDAFFTDWEIIDSLRTFFTPVGRGPVGVSRHRCPKCCS
jgi:hypothetical protein